MILEFQDDPSIHARAILFDLDGTLVESTGAISDILAEWANEIGQPVQTILDFSHGKRSIDIVRAFAAPDQVDEMYTKLTQKFVQSADQTTAISGAKDFLNQLIEQNIPWAVVSSSEAILIQARLAAAGLPQPTLFVSAEDVKQGKPSPEGYLLAAEKLGISIQDCVVFEDAEAGVLAAQSATAQVVIVGNLDRKLVRIQHYAEVKIRHLC